MVGRWIVWSAALAACGASNAAPDGAPDAYQPPNVTVTVRVPGGSNVGVPVWFFESDGRRDAHAITDADGKARAHIGPGASATVDLSGSGGHALESLLGLQPGDDVTIGEVRSTAPANTHHLTVWLSSPAPAGGDHASCDCDDCRSQTVNGGPLELYFDDACVGHDAHITVVDDNGTQYTSLVTATLTDGASVTAGAWTTPPAGTVSLTNVGENTATVQRLDWAGYVWQTGSPSAGQITVPVRPLDPQQLLVTVADGVSCAHNPYFATDFRELMQPITSSQLTATVDGQTDLMPQLSASLDRTGNAFDVGDSGGDFVTIEAFLDGGGYWNIVAPPQRNQRLPPLLPGVAFQNPLDCVATITIEEVDLPGVDGWDAARADAWASYWRGNRAAFRGAAVILP